MAHCRTARQRLEYPARQLLGLDPEVVLLALGGAKLKRGKLGFLVAASHRKIPNSHSPLRARCSQPINFSRTSEADTNSSRPDVASRKAAC
jgi:hypothetical protein